MEDPLEIDGTWNLVLTLGAGTCTEPGRTLTTTTLVELDGDTYRFAFSEPDPDEEITGTTRCSAERCDVNITIADEISTSEFDLEIDSDPVIRGTGTIRASGGAGCTQDLTIAGTIF